MRRKAVPAAVTQLTDQWQADHAAFMDRDLSGSDYVYVWADGIHLRTNVTKGAGSRAAGLANVFKLVESAQARW